MSINQEFDPEVDPLDTSSASPFDEDLYAALEKLCRVFNLDPDTSKDAWEKFEDISSKFTLEGNKVSWLACSLVATCRRQEMMVGDRTVVRSNPISLTQVLRHTNLSLKQFFGCMKAWVVMSKLPVDFARDVQVAEHNFIVCQNVYKSYEPLFKKLFKMPDLEAIKTRKTSFQSTPVGVFEFTWLLFLLLKGKYLNMGDDLIECIKILQCCCNLAFKNVIMLNKREILNVDFVGLPKGWNLPGYQIPREAPCVIDKLFHNFGTLNLADVKYVQDYKIAPMLAKLKNDEGLHTSKDDFSDLFKEEHFEENYTTLTKLYEQYIFTEWCYDENIFLKETYRQIELQGMKCSNGDMIASTPVNERRLPMRVPETPLTGRQYVGPADRTQDNSPDSQLKFIAMLATRPSGMSDNISKMIADCGGENLGEKIVNIEKDLGAKFAAGAGGDDEKKVIGVKLFYYLMEMVLAGERRLDKDIAPLLKHDFFAMCVFTCAMEIVIYATNMADQYKFPWILKCMSLPAVHLVRIIELVVRNTNQFSRNIIKHLSYVEETILESLMWKEDSVLWKDMKTSNYIIPKFEEIARPGTTISASGVPSTPTMRRALVGAGLTQPSPSEPFQSPRYSNIRPGQSLLNSNRNQLANQNASNGNTPRKNGSLGIIFRKFYVLAGVRMDDLCKRLNINDTETRMKIWTFLEATIRESRRDATQGEVWLLKHRHLDQLIMCSVYIVFKLSSKSLQFTDIMQAYKLQPQAHNVIYRQVFFDKEKRGDLIQFYNQIYVQHVKPLIQRICPSSPSRNVENYALSPLPTNPHVFESPRRQVADNVYVNMLESPTNADFNPTYSYYFNRSNVRDLQNINKVVGHSAKRLLTDSNTTEERDNKRLCNRKMQALIEEREVQNMI